MSHDWEADPRPMAECLKEWHARPGWTRNRAAEELRVSRYTYDSWCVGRGPATEQTIRRLMTFIDRDIESSPAPDTLYGDP